MAASYLRKRGEVYWADFTLPPIGDQTDRKRYRISIGTGDERQARDFIDKYVRPLIREASDAGALQRLAQDIARTSDRARAMLQSALTHADADVRLDPDSAYDGPTIEELAGDYIAHLEEHSDLAPASIRKYTAMLSGFCRIIGSSTPAGQIDKVRIEFYRDQLLKSPRGWQKMHSDTLMAALADESKPRINKRSVKSDLQRLRAFWQWAIDEERVPFTTIPGERVRVDLRGVKPNGRKACPTVEQADALLAMAMPKSKLFDVEAWTNLPLLARYTGCRVGELATLAANDIVNTQGVLCLRIAGDHLKTQSSERFVPIADKLADVIHRLLVAHPTGLLFPHAGTRKDKAAHYFLNEWNEKAKKIGAFSFHCLRVYSNTRMAEAGVEKIDRERILGHRNSETQAAYMAVDLRRYKQHLDRIP